MRHVPHLFLPDWTDDAKLAPNEGQRSHLEKVLRISPGAEVDYTDGAGRKGRGAWDGAMVERGDEVDLQRPSELTMAVAPPSSKDRQRYVVEKLAELGIQRLLWLKTAWGNKNTPSERKARAWAISALEQSRGAWLLTVEPDLVGFGALETPLVVCDGRGQAHVEAPRTVAIGPEGGFDPDEIPTDSTLLALGSTTLRVETAAVVAAARLI